MAKQAFMIVDHDGRWLIRQAFMMVDHDGRWLMRQAFMMVDHGLPWYDLAFMNSSGGESRQNRLDRLIPSDGTFVALNIRLLVIVLGLRIYRNRCSFRNCNMNDTTIISRM